MKTIVAFILSFIGLGAFCTLDSDVPVWGTILIITVAFTFTGFGFWLYTKTDHYKKQPKLD